MKFLLNIHYKIYPAPSIKQQCTISKMTIIYINNIVTSQVTKTEKLSKYLRLQTFMYIQA